MVFINIVTMTITFCIGTAVIDIFFLLDFRRDQTSAVSASNHPSKYEWRIEMVFYYDLISLFELFKKDHM